MELQFRKRTIKFATKVFPDFEDKINRGGTRDSNVPRQTSSRNLTCFVFFELLINVSLLRYSKRHIYQNNVFVSIWIFIIRSLNIACTRKKKEKEKGKNGGNNPAKTQEYANIYVHVDLHIHISTRIFFLFFCLTNEPSKHRSSNNTTILYHCPLLPGHESNIFANTGFPSTRGAKKRKK